MTTGSISPKNVSLGQEVKVYCESVSGWVPATVVEFPTPDTVRVQFRIDADELDLRRDSREELDPNGFVDDWVCGRSAAAQASAKFGQPIEEYDEEEDDWMKKDWVTTACGNKTQRFP